MTTEIACVGLALEAIDEALSRFGEPPVGEHPHFDYEPNDLGPGGLYVLTKIGAAPLKLNVGFNFEVWVGPYSEVFELRPQNVSENSEILFRALASEVVVTRKRFSVLIEFLRDGDVWHSLQSFSVGRPKGSDPDPPAGQSFRSAFEVAD